VRPTCTVTSPITSNISIQFDDPVAIHNNACAGEYKQNKTVSSSAGVHTSSCCTLLTLPSSLAHGERGGFMLRSHRKDMEMPYHRQEVRGGEGGGVREISEAVNEACGEETGSVRLCSL
jgi:hypothetical protein